MVSSAPALRTMTSFRAANPWSGANYGSGYAHAAQGVTFRSVNGLNGFAERQLYRDNGVTNNRFASTDSAAASGRTTRFGNNWTDARGLDRGRSYRPRWYYPYDGYTNGYPVLYGSTYVPAYYGGGASYDGGPDADATATYGPDNSVATPNPDFANAAPAAQPRNPAIANPNSVPDNGPDSLVEAVQQELVKRGYFSGKVDAMFGADTREAVRKFQTDHNLAATGLLNEATLHALQLD